MTPGAEHAWEQCYIIKHCMATGANHVIMPAACYNRFSGSVITVFLHCASLRLRSVFLCLNHVARQCR